MGEYESGVQGNQLLEAEVHGWKLVDYPRSVKAGVVPSKHWDTTDLDLSLLL